MWPRELPPARERLLRSVRWRVEQYEARGDRRPVLEADAETAAVLLLKSSPDLRTDTAVRRAVGRLSWYRAEAQGYGHESADGVLAVLLQPVWAANPGAVPAAMRGRYEQTGLRPGHVHAEGPAEWHAMAQTMLGRCRTAPGDPQELAPAVAVHHAVVLCTPDHDPSLATRVADYAAALRQLAARAHDPVVLDTAIQAMHRAVKLTPADDPSRSVLLRELGTLLRERYATTGDEEDLMMSEALADDNRARADTQPQPQPQTRARRQTQAGSGSAVADQPPGLCADLVDRATELLRRYERDRRPEDLAGSVELSYQALAAASAHHPPGLRAQVHNTLGLALRARYQETRRLDDIQRAVESLRAAVEAAAGARVPMAAFRTNLGFALRARHTHLGAGEDLEEAVGLLRGAREAGPDEHADQGALHHNLDSLLVRSFEHTGNEAHLREAVTELRSALGATAAEDPRLAGRLVTLGGALSHLHEATQDSTLIEEAHEVRRRAVELGGAGAAQLDDVATGTGPGMGTSQGHPGPVDVAGVSAFGVTCLKRYGQTRDMADLDEAIRWLRRAVELTPAGGEHGPARRANLANVLLGKAEATRDPAGVDEALELLETAYEATPEGSVHRPRLLPLRAGALGIRLNVAAPLRRRRRRRRRRADVDGAVTLLRSAVTLTPHGHPHLAMRLTLLGQALRRRHELSRGHFDLTEATAAYRRAAGAPNCPAYDRVEAAREWGRACADAGEPSQALEAFAVAVESLPRVAPRNLLRDDQEAGLSRFTGLAADAAACAVRAGDPGRAVRLLEQGRAVLMAQAYDARSDVTELRERAPELAGEFTRLRDALDTTGRDALAPAGVPAESDAEPDAERRHALSLAWDRLIEEIRALPGFARFLLPPDEREIRAVAADGPVVLVNVSRYGSDALVVTDTRVRAVELPGLTPEAAATLTKRIERALDAFAAPGGKKGTKGGKGGKGLKGVLRRADPLEEVWRVLGELWDTAVRPVLDYLGLTAIPAPGQVWPRVWWSPGAPLASLPLHAAGHGSADGKGARNALDHVVSSYTPTLRALREARTPGQRPGPDRPLIVAVPDADGAPRLRGVAKEAQWLTSYLPGSTLLMGEEATRDAVAARLPVHPYVHFACHAVDEADRPSRSRLLLHDHGESPLTVRQVAGLRPRDARLAYLSACSTLRASRELADEAVHIVSAFQLAGYAHVVGTLWPVDDAIAAQATRHVYAHLRGPDPGPDPDPGTGPAALDEDRTAEAVHGAAGRLRADYPLTPTLWACHVHAGA